MFLFASATPNPIRTAFAAATRVGASKSARSSAANERMNQLNPSAAGNASSSLRYAYPELDRGARRGRIYRPRVAWALVLVVGSAGLGCKKTPVEHLRRARDAMYEKDAHRALEEYRHA